MKVNISVPDELMVRVDQYAKKHFCTRSGLMSLALARYLHEVEAVQAMMSIAEVLQSVAEKNELDEESRRQLDALQAVVNLYAPNPSGGAASLS